MRMQAVMQKLQHLGTRQLFTQPLLCVRSRGVLDPRQAQLVSKRIATSHAALEDKEVLPKDAYDAASIQVSLMQAILASLHDSNSHPWH